MRLAYPIPTPLTNAHDDVESLLRCPYCPREAGSAQTAEPLALLKVILSYKNGNNHTIYGSTSCLRPVSVISGCFLVG